MTPAKQPSLFITHGGGPCFFMDWSPIGPADSWDRLGDWLRGLAATLPQRPAAVLVVSAHWETPQWTLTAHPRPPLLYDYHGFPEHTYRLEYPAPGNPELAADIRARLDAAGLPAGTDAARGFDHGVFVPFKLIFPDADVPIVQLALRADLDPAAHYAAGRALAPLREQGVLIVGSGSSYHNLRRFNAAGAPASEGFDAWLSTVVEDEPQSREQALLDWAAAPAARQAHPREEHLLPLMVAAGAAADQRGARVFSDRIMGVRLSNYRFGV